MALVNIINMSVLDNPTAFTNPFQFEVTFECLQELPDGEFSSTAPQHSLSTLIPSAHPSSLLSPLSFFSFSFSFSFFLLLQRRS